MGNNASFAAAAAAPSLDTSMTKVVADPTSANTDEVKVVKQVYAAMKRAFQVATAEAEAELVEQGILTEDVLLTKLLAEFRREHPALPLTTETVIAEEEAGALQAAPARKRKQRKEEGDQEGHQYHGTPSSFAGPSLQRQPVEVIARIANCCDRSGQAALESTSKKMHRVVNDERVVTKPWPLKSFFHRAPDALFFSNDGSRVAAYFELEPHSHGKIELWDKDMGFLGEVACGEDVGFKPVFSPDSQLLLLDRANYGYERGVRVCWLPPNGEKRAPIVVCNHLNGANIGSAAFLDDNTIAFIHVGGHAIQSCKIKRSDGQKNFTISFTKPDMLLTEPNRSEEIASFSNGEKDILPFAQNKGNGAVVFQDRKMNVSVTKYISSANVAHLSFSQNGNLVVSHFKGGSLSVFDCNVERIEDIGPPKEIHFGGPDDFYTFTSFAPNATNLVGTFIADAPDDSDDEPRLRIIDLESEEIVSDGWNESSWKMLVI